MEEWITIKDIIYFAIMLGAFIVKDAVFKTSFKGNITQLEKDSKEQEQINTEQEKKITDVEKNIISIKASIVSINDKLSEYTDLQKEEMKSIKSMTEKNTKAVIKLEVTLDHLTDWIKKNSK